MTKTFSGMLLRISIVSAEGRAYRRYKFDAKNPEVSLYGKNPASILRNPLGVPAILSSKRQHLSGLSPVTLRMQARAARILRCWIRNGQLSDKCLIWYRDNRATVSETRGVICQKIVAFGFFGCVRGDGFEDTGVPHEYAVVYAAGYHFELEPDEGLFRFPVYGGHVDSKQPQ
ncbi:hypothetical protein A0H81_05277 [Grifola frondosa]|uniref:Uncharacterized protein n=1 Tax=Grifola frondosa TaxID=5627 RepID=A0A1C7MCD5_GRIFR|nr:hypothetical protein A0H81_05277 [Grifola frondosa]